MDPIKKSDEFSYACRRLVGYARLNMRRISFNRTRRSSGYQRLRTRSAAVSGLSEIQLGTVKSVHPGTQIAQCKPQV